jgi:hypothetical protein
MAAKRRAAPYHSEDEKWSRACEVQDIFHPPAEAIARLQKGAAGMDNEAARMLAAGAEKALGAELAEVRRLYRDETDEIINSYNANIGLRGLRDGQIIGQFRVARSRGGQDLRARLQKIAALIRVHMVLRAAGMPPQPANWLAERLSRAA